MNCPGSTVLVKALGPTDEDADPDYRRDGILAHELAQRCLTEGSDCWEEMAGFPTVTSEMAQAVQTYLNYVRRQRDNPFQGIEVIDLKYGEGVVVEVANNPQLKYYGFGFLDGHVSGESLYIERRIHLPEFHPQFYGTVDCAIVNLSMASATGDYSDDEPVRLTIVQPRVTWHRDGVIRSWDTTAGALRKWAYEILRPAMEVAEMTLDFQLGDWCRFCPAKLLCPAMRKAADSAVEAVEYYCGCVAAGMSEEDLARYYALWPAVKMFYKAVDERMFRLFNDAAAGTPLKGVAKLVRKKVDRVWKDTAPVVKKLGDAAWKSPEVISPAEAEKLIDLGGKELVAEYAYKPEGTLTLVPVADPREAVDVTPIEQRFAEYVTKTELDGLI